MVVPHTKNTPAHLPQHVLFSHVLVVPAADVLTSSSFGSTSLVAQMIKNLPIMQEIWVQSLGWEDPLEKGKATHSSILAWRIPWTVLVHGVAKSQTRLRDVHFIIIWFSTASVPTEGSCFPVSLELGIVV